MAIHGDIVRQCVLTNKRFVISQAEQEHIRKLEELHPLLRVGDLPLPAIHPLELMRHMQSFVTITALYEGRSCISGVPLITRYQLERGYKVCTREEFWQDKVDNRVFGKEYDFSRSFFSQWYELSRQVYMLPLVQINCDNSPYVDACSNLKDCYMCFGAGESQNCYYCIKSRYPLRNRDCVDCVGVLDCEACYSCVDCEKCYASQSCQDCVGAVNCFGCLDLVGCQDCIGCVGLRQQKFCVFNQQYTDHEYYRLKKRLKLDNYYARLHALEQCEKFIADQNHKKVHIKFSEASSGQYVVHCKNAYQCFLATHLEDCGWSTGANGKDGWRAELLDGELAYNSVVIAGRLGYGNSINTGSENFYSYMIFNSNSCFGSIMLKNNSYCILNKQYSKGEYYDLVPRIIAQMKETGEWGAFLPPQLSPHAYKDSQAAYWFDTEKEPRVTIERSRDVDIGTLLAGSLPEDNNYFATDILQKTIQCEVTGQLYRFDKQELAFYQQYHIPLPRIHWEYRLKKLLQKNICFPLSVIENDSEL